MANSFKIVITASDKATATVRKVKDSIAQFSRPLTQVRASVGALGKEIGLDRMAKGLGRVSAGARAVAEKAAGAVTAVAAIAGVSSIAGVAALARGWAFLGLQIGRTANLLDMGTTKLQLMSGAAQAFGLEAGTMEAGLKSLGDTMEDALYGRNQDALMMMNRLRISVHRLKDGSVDSAQGMYDLADSIQRVKNVQAQGVIARTFGQEALLPFLKLGSAGMRQYEEAVRRSGAAMTPAQIALSERLGRSMIGLKLAATGVGNSIMESLAPSIQPMVDGMTKWAIANRQVIGTRVADFLGGLVGPMKAVAYWLGTLITDTIGWRGAGLALAAVLGARLVPAIWGLVRPLATLVAWVSTLVLSALPGLALQAGLAASALGWEGLASAFVAIGAAIEATPVGWILTAIAAIGFAGYEMWKHWSAIKDGFGKIWDAIPRMFLAGYHKLEPVIKALSYIPFFGVPFKAAETAAGNLQGRVNAGSADPKAAQTAMAYYQSKGWTKEQAAALTGNMAWESGLNPGATGDNGAAKGIGQWHADRQAAFKRWSGGKDLGSASLMDQLQFSNYELTQGSERRSGDALRNQKTVAGATHVINYGYERPAAPDASEAGRESIAQKMYEAGDIAPGAGHDRAPANGGQSLAEKVLLGGESKVPGPEKQTAPGAKPGQPPAMEHKLVAEIVIKGMPKGATAEVKSTTPGAKADVKVDYSMPNLATM